LENVDENYEFSRLKQSMEMVGFTPEKQRRLFAVLSAVLLLGNVEFQPRKSAYHHDEAVGVRNPEVVLLISELLRVKQETLLQALTAKRARASGETLVINYRLPEVSNLSGKSTDICFGWYPDLALALFLLTQIALWFNSNIQK
jgi:myosin-9